MNATYTGSQAELIANSAGAQPHDNHHAVSWGAILAGATSAAALSLILLILGVGLGLSSVSPWSTSGVTSTTFGVGTIAWITFVQLAASGMGGYLAGRLRVRWVAVHADETYFRDTAHGFLAWGVATLVSATMLASTVGSIVGGATQASASAASSVVGAASTTLSSAAAASGRSEGTAKADASGGLDYWIDSLFRRSTIADSSAVTTNTASATAVSTREGGMPATAEAARIVATSVANGTLAPEDASYLAQLVSQRTGLSQSEAQARVAQTFSGLQRKLQDAKDTTQKNAEAARKASAYASLWLFVSLLVGAFVASFAATFGGRQRDM